MVERIRSLARIVALLVGVLGFVPGAAHAQRVLVTHPPLPNPLLSTSGRFIVAVIDNRFLVEDTDQVFDLYRYDLYTNLWTRVPRAALVGSGDPVVVWSSSIELLSISDDGRYVAYVVRRPSATPGTTMGTASARAARSGDEGAAGRARRGRSTRSRSPS